MAILGIDAGGYETKVCINGRVYCFPSDIGEYRELRLIDSLGRDDMIWEYNGEKGFAGTLAKYESEYGGVVRGKTKAHPEVALRILIAVYRHGDENNSIVVGQPIDTHIKAEKDKIKEMLLGEHILTINGAAKTFSIDNVEVAPEGAAAFISNPDNGLVRIVDVGSGTTNFATIKDGRRIDKESFTKKIGTEIMVNKDQKEMAKGIYRHITQKWGKKDKILFTGGGAEKVFPFMEKYLPYASILKPKLDDKLVNPKYANVIGFYKIAKGVFKVEEHQNNTNSLQPE
jgi:plasmid segregation protein ParM